MKMWSDMLVKCVSNLVSSCLNNIMTLQMSLINGLGIFLWVGERYGQSRDLCHSITSNLRMLSCLSDEILNMKMNKVVHYQHR